MENVDIRELIRGVVESMTPTAVARAVELQLSSVPPVEVLGDIRRLEQVFFNLVDNALKFTPKGGRVALDVRIVDGVVEVQVQDNGRGIEPDFLPLVFDRFRQADSTASRAYGGLGLGLSIAKQLVEAHKGSISAESAGKGHGATFTVRLPAAAQRPDEFTGPVVAHADVVRGSSSPAIASKPPIDSQQAEAPHESADPAAADAGGMSGLFSAAGEVSEGEVV
jgi:signal transduction histidine kinase